MPRGSKGHLQLTAHSLEFLQPCDPSSDSRLAELRRSFTAAFLPHQTPLSLLSYLRILSSCASVTIDTVAYSHCSEDESDSSAAAPNYECPSPADASLSVTAASMPSSFTTAASRSSSIKAQIPASSTPGSGLAGDLFAIVRSEGSLLYAPVRLINAREGIVLVKLSSVKHSLPENGAAVIQLARFDSSLVASERWVGLPFPLVLSSSWRARAEVRRSEHAVIEDRCEREEFHALLHLAGRALGGNADATSLRRAAELAHKWCWHTTATHIAHHLPSTELAADDGADQGESEHARGRPPQVLGKMGVVLVAEIIAGPVLFNFSVAKGFSRTVAWMRALTFTPLVMTPGELSDRLSTKTHGTLWWIGWISAACMYTPVSGLLSMLQHKIPSRVGEKEAIISAAIYVMALTVGQNKRKCYTFAYVSTLITWCYYRFVELPLLRSMCTSVFDDRSRECTEQLREHERLPNAYIARLHVFIVLLLGLPLLVMQLWKRACRAGDDTKEANRKEKRSAKLQ